MRSTALLVAIGLTSLTTLAACAQAAPDGPPPGYGQNGPPPGYGENGPPPGYGQGAPPPGYGQAPPPGYGQNAPPPGYGAPQQYAQNAAPPYPPPAPDMQGAPPPAAGGHHGHMGLEEKFAAANVTHDGRLTQQQAEAGGMRGIARHFAEVDRDRKGYVTLQDVHDYHRAKHAEKAAARNGGAYPPPPPAGVPPGPAPSGQQY